jgi:hypothetical protein
MPIMSVLSGAWPSAFSVPGSYPSCEGSPAVSFYHETPDIWNGWLSGEEIMMSSCLKTIDPCCACARATKVSRKTVLSRSLLLLPLLSKHVSSQYEEIRP